MWYQHGKGSKHKTREHDLKLSSCILEGYFARLSFSLIFFLFFFFSGRNVIASGQLQFGKMIVARIQSAEQTARKLLYRKLFGITGDHRKNMNQQCHSLAKSDHWNRIMDSNINCIASVFHSTHLFCCSNGFSLGYSPPETCGLHTETPKDQRCKTHTIQGMVEQIEIASCESPWEY